MAQQVDLQYDVHSVMDPGVCYTLQGMSPEEINAYVEQHGARLG